MSNKKDKYSYAYLSDRELPLVWRRAPDTKRPILTVEQYCKWYNLYLILPSGEVKKILSTGDAWSDADEVFPHIAVMDHCFHPDFIPILAKYLGARIDREAHELIMGRWASEISNDFCSYAGMSLSSEDYYERFINELKDG